MKKIKQFLQNIKFTLKYSSRIAAVVLNVHDQAIFKEKKQLPNFNICFYCYFGNCFVLG